MVLPEEEFARFKEETVMRLLDLAQKILMSKNEKTAVNICVDVLCELLAGNILLHSFINNKPVANSLSYSLGTLHKYMEDIKEENVINN